MNSTSLDVRVERITEQQTYHESVFPQIYVCHTSTASLEDAAGWIKANAERLITESEFHGTVLFRGFPINSPESFDTFIQAFDLPCFAYDDSLSNAVRVNYTPRVFSANEAPPEASINLHHEMAQTPIYPSKLFFNCLLAPEIGGATSLCRSDVLWDLLVEKAPEFAQKCEDLGLKYTHIMPAEADAKSGQGRSWKGTFNASTPEEAEARMSELGYTWQWLDNGAIKVSSPTLPAVRLHVSGRKAFFNQLIAALSWHSDIADVSKSIAFGDDSPLDLDGAQVAVELADSIIFDVPWQPGDVALIDNFVVMHGRRTFQGKRRVLASLVS